MSDGDLKFRETMISYLESSREHSPFITPINPYSAIGDEAVEQAYRLYTAERVHIATTLMIDKSLVDTDYDLRKGAFYNRMSTYVMAMPDEVTTDSVSFPATWWDAVKQRFGPRWLTLRYPVRMTTRTLSVSTYRAVCPHLSLDETKCREFLQWAYTDV